MKTRNLTCTGLGTQESPTSPFPQSCGYLGHLTSSWKAFIELAFPCLTVHFGASGLSAVEHTCCLRGCWKPQQQEARATREKWETRRRMGHEWTVTSSDAHVHDKWVHQFSPRLLLKFCVDRKWRPWERSAASQNEEAEARFLSSSCLLCSVPNWLRRHPVTGQKFLHASTQMSMTADINDLELLQPL